MASTTVAGRTEGTVVLLGTGGTIAGTADSATDGVGYRAAQLGVEALLADLPALQGWPLECEQLAQRDSKDMDHALWLRLAQRVHALLQRPEVCGVVITHGTDTLEETAYFLHRVLAPCKPVVMTAAMRPATALLADGPQNLLDALRLAREPGARGVLAVLAGKLHAGAELRKQHSYRLDAFDGGDAGPLGCIEEGLLRRWRDWPAASGGFGLACLGEDSANWPRVAIVTSHAGADGGLVDALAALGVHGIVVAGTGNGSIHWAMLEALRRAQARGVRVRRVTRCAYGSVVNGAADALPALPTLSAVQARIELLLELLAARNA